MDKVFTNISHLYNEPEVLPPLGFLPHGHGVVICQPCVVTEKPKEKYTVVVRRNNSNSKLFFTHALKQTSWTDLYRMKSCDDQFHQFQTIIDSLLDTHMPKQEVTRYTRHKLWVTRQFESLIRQRQWAQKKQNKALFNHYRLRIKHATKYLRKCFVRSTMANLKTSNPRKWWKHTKQLQGQSGNKDELLKALAISKYDSDTKKLAERINATYQSVTNDLQPLDISKLPLCSNHIPSEYIISVNTVEKKLMKINTNKSVSPDAIPNWVLHDLFGIISAPVCAIFNSSIKEGFIPTLWKKTLMWCH